VALVAVVAARKWDICTVGTTPNKVRRK